MTPSSSKKHHMETREPGRIPDEALLSELIHGPDALATSRRMLARTGSLTGLAHLGLQELRSELGLGKASSRRIRAVFELATRYQAESIQCGEALTSPAQAAQAVYPLVKGAEQERFYVLLLSTRNFIKKPPIEITRGLLDAALVHPREVFRPAIKEASASVILAHNHPSGSTAPSQEDLAVTRSLLEAGRIIDIPVLDHVLISSLDGSYLSLRESGLVNFS